MGKADGTKRAKPAEDVKPCAGAQGRLVGAFTTVVDALDFRVGGRTKFKASEIALITLCSVASGGTSYYDYAAFGRDREAWLRQFLELKRGIPSHDAIRYFWTHLPPGVLNLCFLTWIDSFLELADGDGIHIDGKCIRRAGSPSGKQPCIVSAYSSNERIVIGQVKADEKSNEITAIPKLIDTLYLMGCVVTIDAAGCQREVVRRIVAKFADYLISLKGNQETLHDEIRELFETHFTDRDTRFKTFEATDKGHGRVTRRTCCQTDYLEWLPEKDRSKWAGLRSVCRIETETMEQKSGKVTKDCRYFISSLAVDPERALRMAVSHWDIENPLHWTLDMVFDEDHSRARSRYAAENLAVMRHIVFDMIRRDKVTSGGIKRKKKEMTWSEDKMLMVLLAA